MSGLVRVWYQIRAERKAKDEGKIAEDYLIRGEPNQVIRWSFTTVIALLHAIRILYFDQRYCLITYFAGFYYFDRLITYLFLGPLSVAYASDWFHTTRRAPNDRIIDLQPRIEALFAHKLSSDDFISFVNRILEFKFWYMTTRTIVVMFLLSWCLFLICSLYGPHMFFWWILLEYITDLGASIINLRFWFRFFIYIWYQSLFDQKVTGSNPTPQF